MSKSRCKDNASKKASEAAERLLSNMSTAKGRLVFLNAMGFLLHAQRSGGSIIVMAGDEGIRRRSRIFQKSENVCYITVPDDNSAYNHLSNALLLLLVREQQHWPQFCQDFISWFYGINILPLGLENLRRYMSFKVCEDSCAAKTDETVSIEVECGGVHCKVSRETDTILASVEYCLDHRRCQFASVSLPDPKLLSSVIKAVEDRERGRLAACTLGAPDYLLSQLKDGLSRAPLSLEFCATDFQKLSVSVSWKCAQVTPRYDDSDWRESVLGLVRVLKSMNPVTRSFAKA